MAGRFPGARDIESFWRNLRNGVESISVFSPEELRQAGERDDLARRADYVPASGVLDGMEIFDAGFFGLGPRDAALMDPQHRHFLEVSWEALEHAGYDPARFDGSIGVYAGCGMSAYLPLNLMSNPELMSSLGLFMVRHAGNDKDFLATRVSYHLDLKGPSISVQTACSTSLVAVHLACQSLLGQECDMALAGGVTIELPHRRGYIYQPGEVLSPDGHCRAFDADAGGTVFGSGLGVVVLRRLADALRDGDTVHAVVLGSAVNNDGSAKVSYLAPSVDGQAEVVREAIEVAGISSDSISYVETHGTGTRLGDPIEFNALSTAFRAFSTRRQFCGLGSVKTNIGHLDTAAGVASLIKVVLALKHGTLPPSLNFRSPNPLIDFAGSPFYVNHSLKPWEASQDPRRAGVSSIGVGGTNAHVVLEEAPEIADASPARAWQLIAWSARTPDAVERATTRLEQHFQEDRTTPLADTAYTLAAGRRAFAERRVTVAESRSDAAAVLASRDPKRLHAASRDDRPPSIVFMFPGGGAQYPNMGRELYEREAVFREALDECLALADKAGVPGLRDVLFPDPGAAAQAARDLEARATLGLPATFSVEYAQTRLWDSWGVQPSAMIGHSLGEYVAAAVAQVLTLEDALSLVAVRGRLFDSLPRGAMVSVARTESDLRAELADGVSIAAVNGPSSVVISGRLDGVDRIQRDLEARNIECRRLAIAVPAHSSALDPVLEEFRQHVRRLTLREPVARYVSNVTGTWATADEVTDPDYWVRHLRSTVRFAEGLATLLTEPRVLLEVGPGHQLASFARQHPLRGDAHVVLTSLRHPKEPDSDVRLMLDSLGRAWASGANVDLALMYDGERRRRVPLPTYPFEQERHWIEPGAGTAAAPLERPPGKLASLDEWFSEPVWQPTRPSPGRAFEEKPCWLLFVDDRGVGRALAQALDELGHEVVMVVPGWQFRSVSPREFVIDPRARADYGTLLARLRETERLPTAVVHLWSASENQRPSSRVAYFEECQNLGFYSVLFLLQSLTDAGHTDGLTLWLVGSGFERVDGEAVPAPEKATILGFTQVVPVELPGVAVGSIDLGLADDELEDQEIDEAVEALLAELAQEAPAPRLALRNRARYVRDLRPVAAATPHEPPRLLRNRGTYLVTGGLSGVGLVHAEYLARTVGARLALVSRVALPARDHWDEWLATRPTHDAASERIRAVRRLEELGSDVLVIGADVTSRAELSDALAAVRGRFGRIDGVFHAAGALSDALLAYKTPQQVEHVFAPKAKGAILLGDLLSDDPPELTVLFSSTSTAFGVAGQVDYAGANAFLNALAQARASQPGRTTIAVNWGAWREVGMAMRAAVKAGIELPPVDEERRADAHPLVGAIVASTPDDVIFEATYRAEELWVLRDHRLRGGAVLPGAASIEMAAFAASGSPRADDAPMRTIIEELTFLRPLHVSDGVPCTARVLLAPMDHGHSYSLQTRLGPSEWQEHARARVWVEPAAPRSVDVDALRARCRQPATEDSRDPLRGQRTHVAFGARWNCVAELSFGEDEALAVIEQPPPDVDHPEQFAWDPAALDVATTVAMPLVPASRRHGRLLVPISYGRIELYGVLPHRFLSHVRVRREATSDVLAVFDVTLATESGRVVAECGQFTLKAVAPERLTTPDTAAARRARSRDEASERLRLTVQEGILPEEGMAALARVLDCPSPEVIVSSLDLRQLAARPSPAASARPASAVKFARPQTMRASYQEPRSDIERRLTILWQEVLGVDHVGIHDNFFELGGESLVGLRLFTQMRRAFDVNLPLDTLFTAPTVADCAALIAKVTGQSPAEQAGSDDAPRRSLVVPIQTRGLRPWFFCIHDQNGYVLLYRDLARHLGNDQPLYGIQASGLDGVTPFDDSVEGMARRYVGEMIAVQPEGPYYLGGSSLGGLVAYEMAQQFVASGRDVALLALFDTWTPDCLRPIRTRKHETRLQRAMRHGRELAESGPIAYWARRIENQRRYRHEADVRAGIARHLANRTPMPPEYLERHLESLYEGAYLRYQPIAYPGKITLFRAIERWHRLDRDPLLGWDRVPLGALEVHQSPGTHGYLVREPHVVTLARQLRACIDDAWEQAVRGAVAMPGGDGSSPERSTATA